MLPNLLVIGAQKCGTTSLNAYLDRHPDVHMARGKELDFFLPDRTWRNGVEWYASQFDDAPVRGESSPNYTGWPLWDDVPARAAATVPDARLIYLVRDPLDRIESHYLQRRELEGERRPIDEALGDIEDPGNTYVARSRYATQLDRWLEHFGRDRLLVVAQDDLRDRRAETMAEVFAFAGLDAAVDDRLFEVEEHRSDEKLELSEGMERLLESRVGRLRALVPARVREPIVRRIRRASGRAAERQTLSPEMRARLTALLSDEVVRLRALTGRAFEGWSL
jgi:hypothetical protein